MKVTGKQVRAFWRYMCKRYRCKVIDKDSAEEMQIIGWALDAMGIQDKDVFLKKFTTTLGNRIYIPFEIGVGTQKQLISQIATCVHECQHVVQYRRNEAQFVSNYIFSDASRAHYEADALRTNMEMYWFLTGRLLKPGSLANTLKYYGVRKGDIRVTRKHLAISAEVVKRGGVITGPSKVAIAWWKRQNRKKKLRRIRAIAV